MGACLAKAGRFGSLDSTCFGNSRVDMFMWKLINQLALDEVGSSVTTEMSLVTGVTIGALMMSMSSFSATVNDRFSSVANSSALQATDLERQREEEEKAKRAEFERIQAEGKLARGAQLKK